ncbi:MAG: hypothetical protein IJ654_08595 [Bacteroidales bacterium]|nr:hypothetical protein [Bacteroidales bacterium]
MINNLFYLENGVFPICFKYNEEPANQVRGNENCCISVALILDVVHAHLPALPY